MINPQARKWRHYKGDVYELVRTAKWHPYDVMRAYDALDQPFRLEESPEIEIFLHSEGYFSPSFSHDQDYGTRVFYYGSTGRWARRIEDFLGQTADGQARFTLLDEEAT